MNPAKFRIYTQEKLITEIVEKYTDIKEKILQGWGIQRKVSTNYYWFE